MSRYSVPEMWDYCKTGAKTEVKYSLGMLMRVGFMQTLVEQLQGYMGRVIHL